MTRKKRMQNRLLAVLFVGSVFGFTAATLVLPEKKFSAQENRALAGMPKASLASVFDGTFEEDYEEYLGDQFVGRDAWIGLKTRLELAMGKTEVNGVYFAEDDYLIESHSGTFDTEQAAANVRTLADFLSRYREQFPKERMTVLIAPNAVDTLSALLPAYAPDSGEEAYLKSLEEAVPEGTWYNASAVLDNHLGEQLYYRTDHHWTTLAAFYVYEDWAKEKGFAPLSLSHYTRETLTASFEGTVQSKVGIQTVTDSIQRFVPDEETAYAVTYNQETEQKTDLYETDQLEDKNKYQVFFGGNQAIVRIASESGSGRKLLVIKDSYANCLIPFAIREFSEIDMVDIRYYNAAVSELIAEGGYTDLLFLYNASGFAEDTSLQRLLL